MRTGEQRLILGVGVENVHGIPERGERTGGTVPHAGRNGPARPGHPRHLRESADGVGHEVDDQLRECMRESVCLIGQFLSRPATDVDVRESFTECVDERRRRVDRGDGSTRLQHVSGQRPGPAPDVEDIRVRTDPRESREDSGERVGVTAHEASVRLGRDDETHSPIVRRGYQR